jgi:hypothetical protein
MRSTSFGSLMSRQMNSQRFCMRDGAEAAAEGIAGLGAAQ